MWLRQCFAIVGLAVVATPGRACDVGGADLFQPSAEKFVEHHIGEIPEKPPAPVVEIVEIVRGKSDSYESCEDAGILRLALSLPKSSGFSISELGFYFRVASGSLPDEIFPNVPLFGPVKNGKMELSFPWLDGDPKRQRSFKAQIEVFPIANNLSIGPSTLFKIQAAAGRISKD